MENQVARWKTKLVGWNSLRPRFNEVGESVMHANAIKCFKSEHRISNHSPESLVELDTGHASDPQ